MFNNMIPSRLSRFCLLALLICAGNAFAANPTDFDLANQRYDEGKFAEAKKLYESVVQSGNYSANLFYNLANDEVRLGDLGSAAADYERALILNPAHPEARANLAFLRNETGAAVENSLWMDRVFLALNASSYSIVAAVAGWLALTCFVVLALRKPRDTAPLLSAACICLAVCAYAGTAIWRLKKSDTLAVVTARHAEARFAPADTATLADTLATASHVQILSERGAWTYCELPNQTRAWIAAKDIEKVIPSA